MPTVFACGIAVTGVDPEGVASGPEDGGDGGVTVLPDGRIVENDAPSSVEHDGGGDAEEPDANDSGVADNTKCLAACAGADRSCVDGVCVIDGAANTQVTCPADVPCHVKCTEMDACRNGVNCGSASRCIVECTGNHACQNNGVTCAGDSCDVTCSGEEACKDKVKCTASRHCGIVCSGKAACANGSPECSTDGECTITCGGADGACTNGASCSAGNECKVSCNGKDVCKNTGVTAEAPKFDVQCKGPGACKDGVWMKGGSGTYACGDDACANGAHCMANSCREL